MAAVRRVPSIWTLKFLWLLSKFTEINYDYHHYGRCDYIFGIYNDNPSVKDTERLRRCSTTPVVLSSVKLSTLIPKDMTTFWPSSQTKYYWKYLSVVSCVKGLWNGMTSQCMSSIVSEQVTKLVVITNDTDVIVALLFHMHIYLSSRGSSRTVCKDRKSQHYPFCPSSHFVCTIGSPLCVKCFQLYIVSKDVMSLVK